MKPSKNIHVLPTDKPSRLYLGNNGNFVFGMIQTSIQSRNNDFTNQNIYITSDEEIKEGDWILGLFNGGVIIKSKVNVPKNSQYYKEYGLKIILTTDRELIKDGVQAIPDEFLEWYVKNPSCEEVEVKRDEKYDEEIVLVTLAGKVGATSIKKNIKINYKIIIPKEESKQERSYSEEEVELLLETLSKVVVYQGNDYRLPHYFEYEIKEVIEQFKKK